MSHPSSDDAASHKPASSNFLSRIKDLGRSLVDDQKNGEVTNVKSPDKTKDAAHNKAVTQTSPSQTPPQPIANRADSAEVSALINAAETQKRNASAALSQGRSEPAEEPELVIDSTSPIKESVNRSRNVGVWSRVEMPKATKKEGDADALAGVALSSETAVDAPIAEVPVAEVPVAEVPVAEVPVAEVPVAEVPVAEASSVEASSIEEALVEIVGDGESVLATTVPDEKLAEGDVVTPLGQPKILSDVAQLLLLEIPMATLKESLDQMMQIDGAVAVALVDSSSGMAMGTAGGGPLDLEVAAAGNSEVVKAKLKVMKNLALDEKIEDILITLNSQYHLIRPLASAPEVFIYLVLSRSSSNLAMARHKLASTEKDLQI